MGKDERKNQWSFTMENEQKRKERKKVEEMVGWRMQAEEEGSNGGDKGRERREGQHGRENDTKERVQNADKEKKEEHEQKMMREVEKDKSMEKFWQMINKGRKKRMEISKEIKKEVWVKHFREQYELRKEEEKKESVREESTGEERVEDEEIEEIKKEVSEIIKRMKKKKAAGEDGIPNEAWIYGGKEIVIGMAGSIKKIWKKKIPEEWKAGLVKPIHKKGDVSNVGNYRGITLMDTGLQNICRMVKKETRKRIRRTKGSKQDAVWIQKRKRNDGGNISAK